MSQPGGQICELPSRYRTYLRCSPTYPLCGRHSVDCHQSWRVVFLPQTSIDQGFAIILQARLNNDTRENADDLAAMDESDGTYGVQNSENMTWLRWLWFVFGTRRPTIKPLAIGGTPREQAWGMMLLTSWTANEGLMTFASMNQSFFTISDSGRISWSGYEQATLSPSFLVSRNRLADLNMSLAIVALTLHALILEGALRSGIAPGNRQ